MIMKLGMEHYVLNLYQVYINDDPELTTNFKTMSNLAKLVFVLIVKGLLSHFYLGFVCYVLIRCPDIRSAFTGPLVL